MADYKKLVEQVMSNGFVINVQSSTAIVRSADNAVIPFDVNNKDYRDYLAWIAAGNTLS